MERIGKDLVRKGIEQKIITFGMKDDLLVAHIGDYWFYICDKWDKTESDFSTEQLVEMVYSVVNDEPINDKDEEQANECLYYKAVLMENCG